MSFVHGKSTHFAIDDSGGTLRNISAYCDQVQGLPAGRSLSPVTAFGDSGVKSIPGLVNAQFSIRGHYDPTATTGPHAVLTSLRSSSATSTFNFGPEGNGAGTTKIYGECWLTEYAVDASVDNKISFSATFQVDGTVSETTF